MKTARSKLPYKMLGEMKFPLKPLNQNGIGIIELSAGLQMAVALQPIPRLMEAAMVGYLGSIEPLPRRTGNGSRD
ncbi:MAG: hypothetical protein ACE5R6_16145 [Candidatus Heimdallarchaeota archaeon]